jgi:hypothetical protein
LLPAGAKRKIILRKKVFIVAKDRRTPNAHTVAKMCLHFDLEQHDDLHIGF